jgi:hypothetical protein
MRDFRLRLEAVENCSLPGIAQREVTAHKCAVIKGAKCLRNCDDRFTDPEKKLSAKQNIDNP